MKIKILKKILLLIVLIIGFSYYTFFISENIISSEIIKFVEKVIINENIISSKIIMPLENILVNKNIISEFPVRLKIPSISVDAEVIGIGITATGTLDSPKNIKSVGLYNLGTIPGEKGSAVIDGHFGRINNNPAVFNNLYKLQKGDEIFFHDKNGNIITFIVNEIKIYDQTEATTDIFNSNDGKSHLNIITCNGIWDNSKKSYTNRLVVFSDKLIE